MKKHLLASCFAVCIGSFAWSQTLPTPFDLSSGDYSFTSWDSLATAGTYPPNMVFHTMGSAQPADTAMPTGDYTCSYSLTGRSRFNAEFANGVSMLNAGQGQNATCPGSPSVIAQRFVGEVVLAINSTNRSNISVNWKGRMLSTLTYSTAPVGAQSSRFFSLKLQYSLDTAQGYTNVPGNNAFWCNLDSITYRPLGDSALISNVLPSVCDNQPVVYLRWIYNSNNTGTGARTRLGLDDIFVTSQLTTGIKNTTGKSFVAYPNPNDGQWLNFTETLPLVRLFSADGRMVTEARNTRGFSLQGLPVGMYLLLNHKGETSKLIVQ